MDGTIEGVLSGLKEASEGEGGEVEETITAAVGSGVKREE